MKKLMFLLLLSFLVSAFTGDGITSKELVGHWRYLDAANKGSCNLTFKRDGTFFGNVAFGGKIVWKYRGKWKLRGHIVTYDYTASSISKVPVGKKDHDDVIAVTKTDMVVRDIDTHGPERTYVRVK